ncbi:MAG: hypothetical protein HC857_10040 [Synechococcales cyanobacterium RU_4_20]|nr:hypothetical protein [Synechococcales cyanobacterium RU_4_20]
MNGDARVNGRVNRRGNGRVHGSVEDNELEAWSNAVSRAVSTVSIAASCSYRYCRLSQAQSRVAAGQFLYCQFAHKGQCSCPLPT